MTAPAARGRLPLAALAVAFAAADTYVVVLALPDMMVTVGLGVDELQRAAPIVSGFLLGYVAILPMVGRLADLRGRVPVLVAALVVFSFGSLVTALAHDLPTVVAGRFLQGAGGGGLVPATLALVADLYPAERRAVPLGVVSAVQEIGAVVGPLLGAAILAVARWEQIFYLNLVVGLGLAVALGRGGRGGRTRADPLGLVLLVIALAGLVLVLLQPDALVTSVTYGGPFVPVTGDDRWLSPLALATVAAAVLLLVRCWLAAHPLVDLRGWVRSSREADPLGSLLLALALAGVVVTFASADPAVQVFSAAGPYLLLGSAVALGLLAVHLRRARHPLVPQGTLVNRQAWGGLVVSFFVGAALIAALVDVPVFARLTAYRDSQLLAALVLLRLLVAVPVGAVVGGRLTQRLSPAPVTAGGMALAVVGFAWLATWDAGALEGLSANLVATVPLVLAGLGFGLALAPVNAAVLGATRASEHGLAGAFVVVARMVGMLVGISVLTTVGLRRYFATYRPGHETAAGIVQVHTIFWGAALCAAVASVGALLLLARRTPVA